MTAVSVVIPTLGRWEFLSTAIRAARSQVGVEVEVIVVVDGQRGNAHEGVAALKEPGVRLLRYEERVGVAEARNCGIAAAQADWVALLDDDDVWSPDKLARQLEAMHRDGADFAYTAAAVIGAGMHLRWIEPAPDPIGLRTRLIANNPIPACSSNLLVRRGLAAEVGFDRELKHFADWDFAVRLILSGGAAAVPEVLVGYLWHNSNMHLVDLDGVNSEFLRFRDKHLALGLRLGGPSQSRWIAGSHREAGQRLRAAVAYLRGAVRYRSLPDVARAGGVLLGERAMKMAGGPGRLITRPEPEWLELYR
jgi:glycosyltransferase involved in cell wall biosynthesis